MSVVDSLRQPEYTGENRCGPCTAVNLLLAAGLSAVAWVLLAPWAAVGTFAAAAASIYLRGYLVPGTPTLTKRYLPAAVLRAFGKEPVSTHTVRSVSDDAPSERWLLAAGALAAGDGDGLETEGSDGSSPTLAEPFAERWESALEAVPPGEPTEADLRGALGTEDVSKHADTGAVVDGSQSVRWLSAAAMRADVAASRVFAAGVEGFEAVPPDRRIGLFRDLRLFVNTCPDCGGEVELDERTVEPCCERPHTLLEARCSACGTSLADDAVPGIDGDTPARVRAIRN
jgi:hypothetical protein